MNNKINPGATPGVTGPVWKSRANYLAYTLSNEEIESYYQKFVTRSFTIKYKLDDIDGIHNSYNNMRLTQLSADKAEAFGVKDDLSLPRKDINDPDNHNRYEYENYKFFWDKETSTTEAEEIQNNVDQMMVAKPILISSMYTETSMAQGSILIPRRFDGRPMDSNIAAQNIICIRRDNMICIDKIKGNEIKNPTQKDISTKGINGVMRFSLDIGLPMQGGGLIRCKIPLEAAGEDSFAFFLDPAYNKDYLIFKIRDWVGNQKETGGFHETIKKQNIIQNLHDALQRSQIAQLNERLLEPYTSSISTKYQPPPNNNFQMPVLLPSKPGGSNIKIDGIVQQKTFFQPLNLILNPVASGENNFEISQPNNSYYIRTSADNFNWTNYMQQARLSVPRAVVTLRSESKHSSQFYSYTTPFPSQGGHNTGDIGQGLSCSFPALRAGDLVKQELTGAIGQVTKTHYPRGCFAVRQKPRDTYTIWQTSPYYRDGGGGGPPLPEVGDPVKLNWSITTATVGMVAT